MKKAIIDLETTGLKWNLHEIIEITILIFDDNFEIEKKFNSYVQPYNWHIDVKALEINNISMETLKKAPTGMEVKIMLFKWINEVVMDKIIPYGWNYSDFDKLFLIIWLGFDYYSNIFHYRSEDIDKHFRNLCLDFKLFTDLESFSLKTVCEYFNIPIKAHKSLEDCRATLEILKILNKIINKIRQTIEGIKFDV